MSTKFFYQLRESLNEATKPKIMGNVVMKKKLGKYNIVIAKDDSQPKNFQFVAYVDGDRLDRYGTKGQAEKMVKQFVKELG